MTIQHKLLTGADLHEPKGVASASSGQVYVANGTGSGSWGKLTIANVNVTAITNGDIIKVSGGVATGLTLKNENRIVLNCYMADAANAEDAYVVSPLAGTILNIWSSIYSICDGNTVITPSIGGVNITNGSLSITAAGSAAGDVDSSTPSANNDVLAGQAIKFLSDGGATGALPIMFTVLINVA